MLRKFHLIYFNLICFIYFSNFNPILISHVCAISSLSPPPNLFDLLYLSCAFHPLNPIYVFSQNNILKFKNKFWIFHYLHNLRALVGILDSKKQSKVANFGTFWEGAMEGMEDAVATKINHRSSAGDGWSIARLSRRQNSWTTK